MRLPSMVKTAAKALEGTGINIASVATAFPSGQLDLKMRLAEVKKRVRDEHTEIDMVISRGDFLSGKYQRVFDEIRAVKEACGDAHLKVILKTGELMTFDNVRLASGCQWKPVLILLKHPPEKLVLLQQCQWRLSCFKQFKIIWSNRKMIGMKPAGGIRTQASDSLPCDGEWNTW